MSALRGRVSRRRLLGTGAMGAAGLAGAVLVGCGADDETPTTPGGTATGTPSTGNGATGTPTTPAPTGVLTPRQDTTDQGVPGGVWRHFETSDVPNFDHLGTPSFRTHAITQFLYPTLLQFAPGIEGPASGEIEGSLASEIEVESETRVIFHLRPEVKWDERAPTSSRFVDAEDVTFSWRRFEAEHVRRSQLAHSASEAAPVLSVEEIDSQTVAVDLAFPFSPAMAMFAHHWIFNIMPRESDGGFDPNIDVRGAGPWVLGQFDPGVRLVYLKNPNHWEPNRPFVDEIRLPILGEYAQRLAQFRAGEIFAGAVQQPDIVSTKQEIPELEVFQGEFPKAVFYMMFGLRPGSPFRDERVRQAVSMAIDRDSYIRAFNEVDTFTDADWPVGVRKHNVGVAAGFDGYWLDPDGDEIGEAGQYYEHNPEEANRLVDAAGYPNGVEAPFFFITTAQYGTQYPERAQAYIAMLNSTGAFNLTPRNPDYTTEWVSDYYTARGDFPDGIAYQANSAAPHPAFNLQAHYYTPSGLAKSNYGDEPALERQDESDSILEQAFASYDYEEQVELMHDWQRLNSVRQPAVSEPGAVQPYSLAWPWAKNWGSVQSYLYEEGYTVWPRRWIDESLRT